MPRPDDEFVCKAITGVYPHEHDCLKAWFNKELSKHKTKRDFRADFSLSAQVVINRLRYTKELPESVVTVLKIRLRWLQKTLTNTRVREIRRDMRKYKGEVYGTPEAPK